MAFSPDRARELKEFRAEAERIGDKAKPLDPVQQLWNAPCDDEIWDLQKQMLRLQMRIDEIEAMKYQRCQAIPDDILAEACFGPCGVEQKVNLLRFAYSTSNVFNSNRSDAHSAMHLLLKSKDYLESQTYGHADVTRSEAFKRKGDLVKNALLALYNNIDPVCAALVIAVFSQYRGYCKIMLDLDSKFCTTVCTTDAIAIAKKQMQQFLAAAALAYARRFDDDLAVAFGALSINELTSADKVAHGRFIAGLWLDPFNPRSSRRGQRDKSKFKSQSPKKVFAERTSENKVTALSAKRSWLLRVVPVYQAYLYDAAEVMHAVDNPTHWGDSGLRTVFFGCVASAADVHKPSIYGTVASHCSLQTALRWYFSNVCEADAKRTGSEPRLRMYFACKHSYGVERSYTVLISYGDLLGGGLVSVPSSPAAVDGLPHLIEFVGSAHNGFEGAHFLFRPCTTDYTSYRGYNPPFTLLNLAFHFPLDPLSGFPMTLFHTAFVHKLVLPSKKKKKAFPQDDDVCADQAKFALMKATQLFRRLKYTVQKQDRMDAFIQKDIQRILNTKVAAGFRRRGVTNDEWAELDDKPLMTVASAAQSYLGLSVVGRLARMRIAKHAVESMLHLGRLFVELPQWCDAFGNAAFTSDKAWRTNMRACFKQLKPDMEKQEKEGLHEQIKQRPAQTAVSKAIRDYCWLMATIAYDTKSRASWKQLLCLLAIPVS